MATFNQRIEPIEPAAERPAAAQATLATCLALALAATLFVLGSTRGPPGA